MQKFFNFIQRVNSLLLFGVFATALVIMGMAFWTIYQSETKDETIEMPVKGPAGERVRFRLDELFNIRGANTQMTFLVSTTASRGLSYSSSSEKRNALFIAADDKSARWLFPHQTNVIHLHWMLAQSPMWLPEKVPADERQVLALAFAYSARDTTGDGKIDENDLIDLALTRPDGNGLVTVLSDIDRVFKIGLINRDLVSVLYQASGSVRNARFAVDAFRKVADEEIVAIPTQVSAR